MDSIPSVHVKILCTQSTIYYKKYNFYIFYYVIICSILYILFYNIPYCESLYIPTVKKLPILELTIQTYGDGKNN